MGFLWDLNLHTVHILLTEICSSGPMIFYLANILVIFYISISTLSGCLTQVTTAISTLLFQPPSHVTP